MSRALNARLTGILDQLQSDGLYKQERLISGPQGGTVHVAAAGGVRKAINLCANNYLGLADHPEIVAAAKRGLDEFGFGMSSVRFICGTQTQHRELETAIARYLRKSDAILFPACFDANGGIFEPLLEAEDAIISDALNHASIIDGVRLCKAQRYRFASGNMNELEDRVREADRAGARVKLIATDGVFSMDGHVANLPVICDIAERFDALVMVDDCHATGHLGEAGRGTPSLTGVHDRVHILTGTLGKSLGGAMGGFVAASQPIVEVLRQRARPYLFSNSLAPPVVAGSITAVEIAEKADDRRQKLARLTKRFRSGLEAAGFDLLQGETPIIPVMLGDAKLAQAMASALDEAGVYVAGFFYPVVPHGKARIRTQMSAALDDSEVDFAIDAFAQAGRTLGVI